MKKLISRIGLTVFVLVGTALSQTSIGPISTPQLNNTYFVGQPGLGSIQAAVTKACNSPSHKGTVEVPVGYTGAENVLTLTGCAGVFVADKHVLPYVNYTTSGGTTFSAVSTVGSGITDPGANGFIYRSAPNTYGLGSVSNLQTLLNSDTVNNSSYGGHAGTGGDPTCPSPIAGVDYICFKSGMFRRTHNGGPYNPLGAISLQPGLGDGSNAIPAGTYAWAVWFNDTGSTVTITSIKCVADLGSSTCNLANGAGTSLLTGATVGTSSYASGTQSGTTTIAPGDFIKATFVADGTTKSVGLVITGNY